MISKASTGGGKNIESLVCIKIIKEKEGKGTKFREFTNYLYV